MRLLVLVLSVLWPAAALGQGLCAARKALVAELSEKYGEAPRALGLQQGRGVVELFANEASGSWTILVTSPEGISCLLAAGDAFSARPPPAPSAGDAPV